MFDSLAPVLRRDRIVVGAALAVVVFLSWAYVVIGAGTGTSASQMSGLPTALHISAPMGAMEPVRWTSGYGLLMFVMWWLMMLATMLPSAARMILLFAALTRSQHGATAPYMGTGLFASGYLAVWAGFSILAVGLQWQLSRLALLSPMMVTTSAALGAILLLVAGVWQFTPLKQVCLRNCRAPAEFLTLHWRTGRRSAVLMGVLHGAYCLGCCWMLMLLLFYGGIMNIYWIAGLTTLVFVEKIAPFGKWVTSLAGAAFILTGGLALFHLLRLG